MAAPWPSRVRSYVIGDELGHGAYARVFKAWNDATEEHCALKIVPQSRIARREDSLQFRQEISIMSYLDHPNLVSLKESFSDDEYLYLALDLCEGGDLFRHIVNHGPLDDPTCALIFAQIVSAVAHCHSRGIAHRDIKPENVLITTFPSVKIADFGLAGVTVDGELMTLFCGSACYLAPECHCKIAYDGTKADVWSLGVLLFALSTGNFPWPVTHPHLMVRQILRGDYAFPEAMSAECRALAGAMLQVNPNARATMPQVLAHPFLRLAERSPWFAEVALPPLAMPDPVRPDAVLAAIGADHATPALESPSKKSPLPTNRRLSQGIAPKFGRVKLSHGGGQARALSAARRSSLVTGPTAAQSE